MEKLPLAPLGKATADIAADLINPGIEAGRGVQALQMAPGFKQCFLHNIIDEMRLYPPCSRKTNKTQTRGGEHTTLVGQQRHFEPLELARQPLLLRILNNLLHRVTFLSFFYLITCDPLSLTEFFRIMFEAKLAKLLFWQSAKNAVSIVSLP